MKVVIQQEKTGCAIASAAYIAGTSYQQAKKIANESGIYATDKALWSETHYIHTLLDKLGFQVANKTIDFKDWNSLPDLALLSINHYTEDNKPFWHWVVFAREEDGSSYVHDSNPTLKNNLRTDFDKMQPQWYIQVNKNKA